MSWINLSILTSAEQANNFSEFILENNAISASIQDHNLHNKKEEMIFGEPHNGDQKFWKHTQIDALFNTMVDAKKTIKALETKFKIKLDPKFSEIHDQDWVKKTQKQFNPISILDKVWIIPTWHDIVDSEAINLTLDPGLAFGTGSHPTTHLCIEWMIKNIKKNNVVLDYGCGSGILAICAKKLGASAVTGVDIDPQAIIASEQNAKSNQTDITVKNSQEKLIVQADLVIANILSSAIKVLAPALAGYCLPNGKIALSGILKHQENEIKEIYSEWFVMQKSYYKDGWVCLSGKKV